MSCWYDTRDGLLRYHQGNGAARFYNCQFIISTHSPFLLGLEGAKIYDLDEMPVSVKKWEELDNVKVYYSFFKENKDKFN